MITFNGQKFYRKPNGYYATNSKGRKSTYLHRAIWEFHFGPIPARHHIHHIDHDSQNNDISNLQCLPAKVHAEYHRKHNNGLSREKLLVWLERAQEKAKDWHRSAEGREWHRRQAKQSWSKSKRKQHAVTASCAHCEQQYTTDKRVRKAGYCSAKCQSAARRKSGVDNVTRVCSFCGNDWTCSKYSKARYCSTSCGVKASKRRKLDNE